MAVTVIVDAENVRRSQWPNLTREELVERARDWAAAEGHRLLVVFDGLAPAEADDLVSAGNADDWIAAHARDYEPSWLVTSDRELRTRASGAARTIGGGAFLRMI